MKRAASSSPPPPPRPFLPAAAAAASPPPSALFQVVHYCTDTAGHRYFDTLLAARDGGEDDDDDDGMDKDPAGRHRRRPRITPRDIFVEELDTLTQRRCTQATLCLIGNTPANRQIVVELVGVETAVTVRLPPLHAAASPYPRDRPPDEALRSERAHLALAPWEPHAAAVAAALLRAAATPRAQRRTFRHELLASSEFYGHRGAEQDAFLRLYTSDFDAARRLADYLRTHPVRLPAPLAPSVPPFALRLVDTAYDHVQRTMLGLFGGMARWIALRMTPSVAVVEGESRASLHVRLPIEEARACLYAITDAEDLCTLRLPNVAPLRVLAMDLELHAPRRIDPSLPDAYITTLSACVQLDAEENEKVENVVGVFQPVHLAEPDYVGVLDALPAEQRPAYLAALADANGQLPTRATAPPVPRTAPSTLGPEARVEVFEHEHDLLEWFIGLLERTNPDMIIGFFHTYMDIDCVATRCRLFYPHLYTRLLHSGVFRWWRGYAKEINKESNARQALGKKIIELPGRLYPDMYDLAQEGRVKLTTYTLDHVARAVLHDEGKVDNDFESMFYCFWKLHRADELRYVMQDSVLCLKLFRAWRYGIEVFANADRACITPKCFVECMQQARLTGRIRAECIESNVMFAVRDLEAFRSLAINRLDDEEALARYCIVPLHVLQTQPAVGHAYTAGNLDEVRMLVDKQRSTKPCLLNVYDLPPWELRRQVEATPDNARCKGGMVQPILPKRIKIGGCGDVAGMYARLFVNQCASPDNLVVDERYADLPGVDYLHSNIEGLPENHYVPHRYCMAKRPNGILPRIVRFWTECREYHKQQAARALQRAEAIRAAGVHDEESKAQLAAALSDYVYHDTIQKALKQLINSVYGSMLGGRSTAQVPLNAIGQIITFHGRRTIVGIREHFKERGFFVLYGDTDSVMVSHRRVQEMLSERRYTDADIEAYRNSDAYRAVPLLERQTALTRMRTERRYTDQECFTFFRTLMLETCVSAGRAFNVEYEMEKNFAVFLPLAPKMYIAKVLAPHVTEWPSDEALATLPLLLRGVRGGVRRDVTAFTRTTLNTLYKVALDATSPRPLLELLCRRIVDLVLDRVPLEDCAITKTLKRYLDYMVEMRAVSGNVPADKFYDASKPLPTQALVAIRESRLHPAQLLLPGAKVTYLLAEPAYFCSAQGRANNERARAAPVEESKKGTLAISLREAKTCHARPYYLEIVATLQNEFCTILARISDVEERIWEVKFGTIMRQVALLYDTTGGGNFFRACLKRYTDETARWNQAVANGTCTAAEAAARIAQVEEEELFDKLFALDAPVSLGRQQHQSRVRAESARMARAHAAQAGEAALRREASEKYKTV